jgi:hypothetical protein
VAVVRPCPYVSYCVCTTAFAALFAAPAGFDCPTSVPLWHAKQPPASVALDAQFGVPVLWQPLVNGQFPSSECVAPADDQFTPPASPRSYVAVDRAHFHEVLWSPRRPRPCNRRVRGSPRSRQSSAVACSSCLPTRCRRGQRPGPARVVALPQLIPAFHPGVVTPLWQRTSEQVRAAPVPEEVATNVTVPS